MAASTPVPVNEELRAPLSEVRKDLLDFGLRNPLLNYRLLKTRGLEVPGFAPVGVFRALVTEGAELSFVDVEKMRRPGLPLLEDETMEASGQQEDFAEAWLRRKELPTGIPEKELEKRLLATYYTAKSSIEEQGVNTLYVALGMLM
jgi:hypothetical protein